MFGQRPCRDRKSSRAGLPPAGEHDWVTSGLLRSGVTTSADGSARSRAGAGLGRDVRVPRGTPRLALRHLLAPGGGHTHLPISRAVPQLVRTAHVIHRSRSQLSRPPYIIHQSTSVHGVFDLYIPTGRWKARRSLLIIPSPCLAKGKMPPNIPSERHSPSNPCFPVTLSPQDPATLSQFRPFAP